MEQELKGYYKITEAAPNVYRIFSPEGVFVELFVGAEKALLFDTGYGFYHLNQFVKSITSLPLYIVNSHGHLDHTCGNSQFEEDIYIHPRDMELCREHNTAAMREKGVENAKHTMDFTTGTKHNILPQDFDLNEYLSGGYGRLVPVTEGYIFDLGGITLKTVELPGHTQGSIGLIYEEERLLYAGDALNSFLWLFMPEATDLATYINTIRKAMNIDFDKIVMAHDPVIAEKRILENFLDCAAHVDLERGVPFDFPFGDGCDAKICFREGYGPEDIGKPGMASIVINESHL